MLPQENTIPIEDDPQMIELFKHLDSLSAFVKLHEAWLEVNDENWHSHEMSISLKKIFNFVNQLASYISLNHENIEVQINVEPGSLERKQFATVIKRTDEWKSLKKWIKIDQKYKDQTLTVRAICTSIHKLIKEFICKVQ